jgi:hypothetical protein
LKEQQNYEILHNDGLGQHYDDKLLQELQQLRAQNDQEIVSLREEIALQYEKKVCPINFFLFVRMMNYLDGRFIYQQSSLSRTN